MTNLGSLVESGEYTGSRAMAINAKGQVVGYSYIESCTDWCRETARLPFLWLPEADTGLGLAAGVHYLGTLTGFPDCRALFVNDSSQVVGLCLTGVSGQFEPRAFLWLPAAAFGLPAGMNDLGALPDLDLSEPGERFAFNNAAQIIGLSWGSQEGDDRRGFIWEGGVMYGFTASDWGEWSALNTLCTPFDQCASTIWPAAINATGVVAGTAQSVGSTVAGVVWDPNAETISVLPPEADGSKIPDPRAINAGSEVVGNLVWLEQVSEYSSVQKYDAFLWLPAADEEAGLTQGRNDLGVGTAEGVTWCSVAAITDDRRIVGALEDQNGAHVWVWNNGTVFLMTVPGAATAAMAEPWAVSAGGQVAGQLITQGTVPFFWSGDVAEDAEILPGLGGIDGGAEALNEAGQVAGWSAASGDHPVHACLWTPASTESALAFSEATVVRHGRTITVQLEITNPGTDDAMDVTVTAATLGGVETNSVLPLELGRIKSGRSKQCRLQFQGVPAGEAELTVTGTSSLGDIFTSQTINVPL